jgi:hypothetical protein
MIDEKYWEDQLGNLSFDELKEVTKVINRLKKKVDTREEFIEVLRHWQKRYPEAKYFCTGRAWKGAYESSSEFGADNWDYIDEDLLDRLYRQFDKDASGDPKFMKQFKDVNEFFSVCLNIYIIGDKDFRKEVNSSLHKPNWSDGDAHDLYEGEAMYEFIDIKTGKTITLYENAY